MKTPIINFQDYLEFRKNPVAIYHFGVTYDDLSTGGKQIISDEVGGEYIKIFNLLYN
jgi:hypothetical protein